MQAARAGTAAGRGMSTEIKAASADWRPSWGPSACHNGAFLTPAEKIELEVPLLLFRPFALLE